MNTTCIHIVHKQPFLGDQHSEQRYRFAPVMGIYQFD